MDEGGVRGWRQAWWSGGETHQLAESGLGRQQVPGPRTELTGEEQLYPGSSPVPFQGWEQQEGQGQT